MNHTWIRKPMNETTLPSYVIAADVWCEVRQNHVGLVMYDVQASRMDAGRAEYKDKLCMP